MNRLTWVRVPLLGNNALEKIDVELSEPPEGSTLRPAQQSDELVLDCDATKVKPGLRGNLILSITGQRAAPQANQNVPPNRRRVPLGTLPAIPFEIIRR